MYRRILYKIPLKLLLVLLAIFWLLFACTKADLVLYNSYDITQSVWWNYSTDDIIPAWHSLYCVKNKTCSSNGLYVFLNDYWRRYYQSWNGFSYWVCWTDNIVLYSMTAWGCTFVVDVYDFWYYSSQQCQSEYNLIPIDEVDSSYCESNNLCLSSSDPIDCPNVWVSNVFINDLFHPWAFNIVMNIPQEIDRDYAYTNSWNNMNIDIVGYNVDYEKMQEVIDTQNYKPNSDDLSTIVSQIVPLFVPWLCIILLLYFIFRFIKKIF